MLITRHELELHPVVVSKTYASGTLDYHGAEFVQLGPVNVDAVLELQGSEINIRGHVGARLGAACDRCLASVEFRVDRDFDLFYRPIETIARAEEVNVPEDELEVGFFSRDGIALADVVTEQVILAVPMKVICRADCRGLCPVCGNDLNKVQCGCVVRRDDSPFASLMNE